MQYSSILLGPGALRCISRGGVTAATTAITAHEGTTCVEEAVTRTRVRETQSRVRLRAAAEDRLADEEQEA